MSTTVTRPISFTVTLILKDGRQFVINDVKRFYTWVSEIESLSRFEIFFYDGSVFDIFLSKIDRILTTVLFYSDVIPFDYDDCDYHVREFADQSYLSKLEWSV